MRIESPQMKALLELARNANNENIKALTDSEKKTVMAISQAIKSGRSSIDLKGIQEQSLESIKTKLTEKQNIKHSSFFEKILKFFLNLFNLRTSSHALKKDVLASSMFLTENLARLEKIEKSLKEKMGALEKLIGEDGKKESIAELKKEISMLSKEKARLESLVFPLEDKTKTQYAEKEKAINKFKKEIPGFLREAKAIAGPQEIKKDLLAYLEKANADSDQFRKDYTRTGFKLKISDPLKGDFVGLSKPKESTSSNDYFEFHQEGFNKIFSPSEQDWKQLVQEMVTQTPLNLLMTPVHLKISIDENTGNIRNLKAGDTLYPVIFDVNSVERNVSVEVARTEGSIASCTIKIRMHTPIHIGKLYEGNAKARPIDPLGYVDSSMSFTLTYNENQPDVKSLKVDHVFKNESPLKREEETPGFFPRKEITQKEEREFNKKIKVFLKTLEDIKFDQRPTTQKIPFLKEEIQNIEEALSKTETQKENDQLQPILERYQLYLESIQSV